MNFQKSTKLLSVSDIMSVNSLVWAGTIEVTDTGKCDVVLTTTTGYLFWKKEHKIIGSVTYVGKHKTDITNVNYYINGVIAGKLDIDKVKPITTISKAMNIARSKDLSTQYLPNNWSKYKLDLYFPLPKTVTTESTNTGPTASTTKAPAGPKSTPATKKASTPRKPRKTTKTKPTNKESCGEMLDDCCGAPDICSPDNFVSSVLPLLIVDELVDVVTRDKSSSVSPPDSGLLGGNYGYDPITHTSKTLDSNVVATETYDEPTRTSSSSWSSSDYSSSSSSSDYSSSSSDSSSSCD